MALFDAPLSLHEDAFPAPSAMQPLPTHTVKK